MNTILVTGAPAAILFRFLGTPLTTAILPSRYDFEKALDFGSWCYHDPNKTKLAGGICGIATWSANAGPERVGWVYDSPVKVDFDFGSSTWIDSIHVGTVQNHVHDVVVPSKEILSRSDGTTWSPLSFIDNSPESSGNDNQYFTFSFDNLAVHTQYVRVQLTHTADGPWTFVDELDFFAVLAPPSQAILGLRLAGIGFSRRKRLSRSQAQPNDTDPASAGLFVLDDRPKCV